MTVVGSQRDPRRDWKPVAASVFKPRMSLVLQSLLPHPDSCQGTSPYQQGWDTKMAHLSHGAVVAFFKVKTSRVPRTTITSG